MRKLEAVIFDWAGTTVDYGCFAPVQAFADAFASFDIYPTTEEIRKPMGLLKRTHIQTILEMDRISTLWQEVHQKQWDKNDVDCIYDKFEETLLKNLKDFSEPKPDTLETVNYLRKLGIKIGSTTGYTNKMMDIVVKQAAIYGYAPDVWVSPDTVNGLGRPFPYMIFRNLEKLNVSSVQHVIKVGDTVSDIKEGKHADVFSIGVIEGSSEMGLTQKEYESLGSEERDSLIQKVEKTYDSAGADGIILNLKELPKYISEHFIM